jgi:hypothetical protein
MAPAGGRRGGCRGKSAAAGSQRRVLPVSPDGVRSGGCGNRTERASDPIPDGRPEPTAQPTIQAGGRTVAVPAASVVNRPEKPVRPALAAAGTPDAASRRSAVTARRDTTGTTSDCLIYFASHAIPKVQTMIQPENARHQSRTAATTARRPVVAHAPSCTKSGIGRLSRSPAEADAITASSSWSVRRRGARRVRTRRSRTAWGSRRD